MSFSFRFFVFSLPFLLTLLSHLYSNGRLGRLGRLGQLGRLGRLGRLGGPGMLGRLGRVFPEFPSLSISGFPDYHTPRVIVSSVSGCLNFPISRIADSSRSVSPDSMSYERPGPRIRRPLAPGIPRLRNSANPRCLDSPVSRFPRFLCFSTPVFLDIRLPRFLDGNLPRLSVACPSRFLIPRSLASLIPHFLDLSNPRLQD